VGDEMIFTSYIVLALAWGICKGDKAPFFRERNQHGQIVKMPDEQEKNTLMVFTNDMCGTCKHVVPELDHVKRHYTDLRIIVVSNPIYYEEGLQVPDGVHLIRSDGLMNTYLIHSVPTAMLIDREGIILATQSVSSYENIMDMIGLSAEKVS
jgi:thioredoxin-related protein